MTRCLVVLVVSILVFVELVLDDHHNPPARLAESVSILVFVELVLDVPYGYSDEYISCCFNPCFRGTCS